MKRMIKAGSLYYAIVICVLVGICCACFMLVGQYSKMHTLVVDIRNELLSNNISSSNYFLGKIDKLKNASERVDLFDNEIYSEGSVSGWGFFEVLTVKSSFKNDTIVKHCLVAEKIKSPVALYLADNEKPLQMVGKAKIIGDAYLPKKGIKKGYIKSQSFSSFTFLEGSRYQSKSRLPKLENVFTIPDTVSLPTMLIENIKKDTALYNSFIGKPLHISVNAHLIEGRNFSGNIIVSSKDSIFISKENHLEDVLIDAPIVVFERGFKGTIQVKATKKVELQQNVVFQYPSTVYVEGDDSDNGEVILGKGSVFLGSLAVVAANSTVQHKNLVSIEENAKMIGTIYCQGDIELKGSIEGSLFTESFLLKTESSSYENYIKSGIINSESLPEYYLGVPFSDIKLAKSKYGFIKSL